MINNYGSIFSCCFSSSLFIFSLCLTLLFLPLYLSLSLSLALSMWLSIFLYLIFFPKQNLGYFKLIPNLHSNQNGNVWRIFYVTVIAYQWAPNSFPNQSCLVTSRVISEIDITSLISKQTSIKIIFISVTVAQIVYHCVPLIIVMCLPLISSYCSLFDVSVFSLCLTPFEHVLRRNNFFIWRTVTSFCVLLVARLVSRWLWFPELTKSNEWYFRPWFCLSGAIQHRVQPESMRLIFGVNHAPGAGSIVRPVHLQSRALPLNQ